MILPILRRQTLTIFWFLLKKGLKIDRDLMVWFIVVYVRYFMCFGIVSIDRIKSLLALASISFMLIYLFSFVLPYSSWVFDVFLIFTSQCYDFILFVFIFGALLWIWTFMTELYNVFVFGLFPSSIFDYRLDSWRMFL